MKNDFYSKVNKLGDSLIDTGNRLNLLTGQRTSIVEIFEKSKTQFSSGQISKKAFDQTTSHLGKELGKVEKQIQKTLEKLIKEVLKTTN
jgi:hypothetical protein